MRSLSAEAAPVIDGNIIRPEATQVSIVKADTALLSLRSSGHDFCSAIGEVVDNSLEAGANMVRIRLFTGQRKVGSNKKATTVIERVALGDDGGGMPKDVLHRSLQLGFSTRYNSRLGMGRFGVGAKLGGISQAQRIDITSRQLPAAPWLATAIDLEDVQAGEEVIPEPTEVELENEYVDLVGEDRGTLVVWSKTDRLQEKETGGARQADKLKTDLVNYLARTFRKFLDAGKQIWVDGERVLPHDPLFLMSSTRFHDVPEKAAVKVGELPTSLKFPKACSDRVFYNAKERMLTYRGPMGEDHWQLLRAMAASDEFEQHLHDQLGRQSTGDELAEMAQRFRAAIDDLFDRGNPDPIATVVHTDSFEFPVPSRPGQTSPVEVTVTLLPEKFWAREQFTDRPGGSKAAKERRIDENEGVSILRAGREIFNGLLRGVQPTRAEIDRFIGIEIRFRPDLDECFQVRNVKKGAEPVNGLRDRLREEIYKTVITARNRINVKYAELRAKSAKESHKHSAAEQIVADAGEFAPKPRAGENVTPEEREQKAEEAAKTIAQAEPHKKSETVQAILKRPVNVVPKAWPGSEFVQIEHLGTTAIVYLNTQHPFYTEVYARLTEAMQGGSDTPAAELARSVQIGLDLLLLSYAQAEGMEKDADQRYQDLRTYWGTHLKNNVQQWVGVRVQ